MKLIDLIDQLHEKGELIDLITLGVVEPRMLVYRKVYHTYYERLRVHTERGHKQKKMQALEDCSHVHKYGDRHIYRIVKFMNAPCKHLEMLKGS